MADSGCTRGIWQGVWTSLQLNWFIGGRGQEFSVGALPGPAPFPVQPPPPGLDPTTGKQGMLSLSSGNNRSCSHFSRKKMKQGNAVRSGSERSDATKTAVPWTSLCSKWATQSARYWNERGPVGLGMGCLCPQSHKRLPNIEGHKVRKDLRRVVYI